MNGLVHEHNAKLNGLAYEHNGRRVTRERFYEIACDPRRSVAVEACAGAGKTWMLVSRILRALLAGAKPHEILAITFTKKAAGEMRQRLHEWLEAFADATPERLTAELKMRGIAQPSPAEIASLQGLYAQLLESGRPVQIRTFHSWFAALLRNAPLAVMERLELPANYELLEDDSEAIDMVWRRFHTAVAAQPEARRDFEACVTEHGRFQTQKALLVALNKRVEFLLADENEVVRDSVKPAGEQFPRFAGLERPDAALDGDIARRTWLARARALGAETNKTPQKTAEAIVKAFETQDLRERFTLLRKAFFVATEDRLNTNLSKFPAAQEAEPELQALCTALAQHDAYLHHERMTRLARVLIAEFAALKRDRGWVDMNDVERAAQAMLADPVLSGWVQERLDARIAHLLIDEFQDTNPLQWQALYAWLSGYAGAGGTPPGVFIVGDPKQSIYRFRRAEPQVFHAAKRFIADGLEGDVLSCDHTHRNAPEIIAAVNAVMSAAQAAHQYEGFREHTTEASTQGSVLRLPQVPRMPKAQSASADVGGDEGLAWRDSLTVPRELPEEKLIALECRQAAAWIAQAIAAGAAPLDIMVLARKRDRLAAMEDELRALHIPAQQPEKTKLIESSEVQDIVALLDVLVSTSHDLSLARALKSPLFGLDDEVLVAIAVASREARAQNQPRSWFELLRREPEIAPGLQAIGEKLVQWKALIGRLPPHDALDEIYHQGDVVSRFAAAAPPPLRDAAIANLHALLGAALDVDGGRYATPYAFVRALKAGAIEGPALSQSQAVRLLTVHGAKGLEAPVVLMLDTDGAAQRAESMGVVVEWPGEAPSPWRFAFIASESRPPPCSVDALDVEKAARLREELNALYVAMTRAKRQLVISSVEPYIPNGISWWQRLLPVTAPIAAPVEAHVEPASGSSPAANDTFALPALPALAASPVPRAQPRQAPVEQPDTDATRFGKALHRLLEERGAGRQFTAAAIRAVAREFSLAPAAASQAAEMAQRILAGEGAWAFDTKAVDWQANEVPLQHQGELLRLDRLVRRASSGEWWVFDYKSHTRPEDDPSLIAQLQGYRTAVQAANPGAKVQAAFLTGQGRLVVLP